MSVSKTTQAGAEASGTSAGKAKDRGVYIVPLQKVMGFIRLCQGAISSAYANDPKFKKYTQQVDKCLVSFDSVNEWADFISFLKQLLKVCSIIFPLITMKTHPFHL